MKKRALSILITFCLLVSNVTVMATTASYDFNDDGIDDFTFDDETGTLTIHTSDCIASESQYLYSEYDIDASYDVETVIIEDGISEISSHCFAGFQSITSVIIPDSVTEIEEYAFWGCSSLMDITLPEGLTDLYSYAFSDSSLSHIIFTGDVPTFYSNTFSDVTAKVYYPEDNDTWTEDVMQDYGGDITWVAYRTNDEDAEKVYSGTCGDNAYWSFDESTGTLTISGSGDMYDIGWAVEIEWDDDTTYINSYNDQPWYGLRFDITSVIIEDGITSIGEYAFTSLENLTSVSIGSDVTSIGYYAFGYCVTLPSVTIPGNVKTVGDFAFDACNNLNFTIEDGVETIGEYAFRYNYGTTELVIPDSVTTIGQEAFYWTSLERVTIGSGVTSIGQYAFGRNYSLSEVVFTGDVPEIGHDAFDSYYNDGDERNTVIYAYYPANNSTWTEDVLQQYGGVITWVAYEIEDEAVLGDANLDGSINYLDAMTVLRADAELIELTDAQIKAADVNDDGSVNSLDAILILRYDAGLIESFE